MINDFPPLLPVIIAGGFCLGSFLNVLIDRIPAGKDIFTDRSQCDYCHKKLRWYELIPLFSFLFQRGRCRRCKKKLSFQYPLIEFLTGLLVTGVAYQYFPDVPLLLLLISLLSVLLVLIVIDLKLFLLPDSLILAGFVLAFVYVFFYRSDALVSHLMSGGGVSLFFYGLWRLTKRKGIGFGDVKLVLVLGVFLGYPLTLLAMYAAFLTGAITGIILVIGKGKTLKTKLPFGPFLIVSSVVVFLLEQEALALFSRFFVW